jgi:hypothetical protein
MPSRADLQRARDDLAEFARLVGRPLKPWQAESLLLKRRVTVIVAPRQTGKSRSLAVLALHRAFRTAGVRVLVVSAGEDAAKRLLGEVRAVALGSPLLAGSVVDEQSALVTLTNGSEIRSVPASERAVRGWTVDVLIVDEAASVEDDLILGAALPTTAARPDARIVLAGSPLLASGAFYEYAQRGWSGSDHVASHRWGLADADWISADVIASLREGLTDSRIRAELEAEFIDPDAGEALISRELVEEAQARTLPVPRTGVVGLDVARFGRDRTVAYVNRGGHARLLFEGRGWDLMATTGRLIAELREKLNAPPENIAAVVDDTGVGGGVTDRAREQGVAVSAFVGAERAEHPERHANRRASTYWAMRSAFADGLVDIDPADVELAEQLVGLRTLYDSRGRLLIESKDAMRKRGVSSPDRADALCMTFARSLWRPVEAPSPADEARALLARMNAAIETRKWREASSEAWFSERNASEESNWQALGLNF